jgi:hypothetical protein
LPLDYFHKQAFEPVSNSTAHITIITFLICKIR